MGLDKFDHAFKLLRLDCFARGSAMSSQQYNVVVVGLGAMGSATVYHLARRGCRVLGLEQFAPGHARGSSHGDSRIIRETYFEHPLYVPLAQRAHDLWRDLEKQSGASLMTITGGLMIGPPDGAVVSGTLRSAAKHNLPHEVLTSLEVAKRFPAFSLTERLVAVFDPRAGFLDPEACNRAHIRAAGEAGAEVRFNEAVIDWIPEGKAVRVISSAGDYTADRLVLAAGPWNRGLLPDLELPLTIERQTVFWLEADGDPSRYDVGSFPIYAYEYRAGNICYGFPRLPRGIKASVMHDGETVRDPESVDRAVKESEVNPLRAALRPVLPGLAGARVHDHDVCLFTNTPDHDFVIDVHPFCPAVLISSPCSGHGFKFSSAIGEIQADLVTKGETEFDLSPFRIGRWIAS
jgi:sarcosine oxidase